MRTLTLWWSAAKPQFEDDTFDMLLNPNVIFEVLSKSTEEYDRKTKLSHYRTLPSLTDYVLVSQDAYHVEQHSRQPDGGWMPSDHRGLDATLMLKSIGCELKLSEIYRQIIL